MRFLRAFLAHIGHAMSHASPAVRRVIAVLNFFADHPDRAFTLTDIARSLKISQATAHGLLAGLVEGGYLYRLSDKSYLLGPALLAVGEVAREHFSPLKAAQPEMRRLADRYDAVCTASFREHDDVVVREKATPLSHLGYSVPRDVRLPLLPQFASLFFVWSSAAECDAWLDQLNPPPHPSQREAMRQAIDALRQFGFLCGVRNPDRPPEADWRRWILDREHDNAPVQLLNEIDEEARYDFSFVQVPVLVTGGEVAFAIGLQGFSNACSGREILEIAETVKAAGDRISGFISRKSNAAVR